MYYVFNVMQIISTVLQLYIPLLPNAHAQLLPWSGVDPVPRADFSSQSESTNSKQVVKIIMIVTLL